MQRLEKMDAFFDCRVEDYDRHMLEEIDGAGAFYPFTASQLPAKENARILDLGCGTGLELQWYFAINPSASVTGIDLALGMLQKLREKFPEQDLHLICGSYFDVPFPTDLDGAVSVESLHHFTKDEKRFLYRKLQEALRGGGCFVLTDYFSLNDEEERLHRQSLRRLKEEYGLAAQELYHYDTPLTVSHEMEALQEAGFRQVKILKNWGATYTLKAVKGA